MEDQTAHDQRSASERESATSAPFFTRWGPGQNATIEVMKRGETVVLEAGYEETGITRIRLSASEALALSVMLSYKARELLVQKGL